MAKNLQLVFRNREGKVSRITIDHPQEPIDPQAVSAVMDTILAADVFNHSAGLIEKVEARLVDTNVEQIQVQ